MLSWMSNAHLIDTRVWLLLAFNSGCLFIFPGFISCIKKKNLSGDDKDSYMGVTVALSAERRTWNLKISSLNPGLEVFLSKDWLIDKMAARNFRICQWLLPNLINICDNFNVKSLVYIVLPPNFTLQNTNKPSNNNQGFWNECFFLCIKSTSE